MNNSHNNRGTSILFVLAALIVTGFVGVAMIKMVAGDRMSAALYSTSASARSAAKSGIISGINWFETSDSTDILALLRGWINNPTNPPEWLNVANGTEFIDLTTNDTVALNDNINPKCQTQLVAFDENNFTVTLMAQGIGKGGARATVTSVYRLEGLLWDRPLGPSPLHALQMDNGNNEFNCELYIKGNTSLSDTIVLNDGPFVFDGNLRVDPHRTSPSGKKFGVNGPYLEVKGNAYFNEAIRTYSTLKIGGSVGFDKPVYHGRTHFEFGDTAFINSNMKVNGSGNVDLDGTFLFANTAATYKWDGVANMPPSSYFTDYSSDATSFVSGGTPNLPNRLGFGVRPPEIKFNYTDPLLHPSVITVPSGAVINAGTLNTAYQTAKANNTLWKDKFIVVHFPASYLTPSLNGNLIQSSTVKFDGKAIIIVETDEWQTIPLETTTNANVALGLLVPSKFTDTPHLTVDYFRGFLFVDDRPGRNRDMVLNNGGNSRYDGAMYSSPRVRLRLLGNNKHSIYWDQNVVNELAALGLFSDPQSDRELIYDPNYANLFAHIVSQSL